MTIQAMIADRSHPDDPVRMLEALRTDSILHSICLCRFWWRQLPSVPGIIDVPDVPGVPDVHT